MEKQTESSIDIAIFGSELGHDVISQPRNTLRTFLYGTHDRWKCAMTQFKRNCTITFLYPMYVSITKGPLFRIRTFSILFFFSKSFVKKSDNGFEVLNILALE